jgi:hypothetical protein
MPKRMSMSRVGAWHCAKPRDAGSGANQNPYAFGLDSMPSPGQARLGNKSSPWQDNENEHPPFERPRK